MDSRISHLLASLSVACHKLEAKPEAKAEIIETLIAADNLLWSIIDEGTE